MKTTVTLLASVALSKNIFLCQRKKNKSPGHPSKCTISLFIRPVIKKIAHEPKSNFNIFTTLPRTRTMICTNLFRVVMVQSGIERQPNKNKLTSESNVHLCQQILWVNCFLLYLFVQSGKGTQRTIRCDKRVLY